VPYTAVTNGSGVYTIPRSRSANYVVKADMTGFASKVTNPVTIEAGQIARLNFVGCDRREGAGGSRGQRAGAANDRRRGGSDQRHDRGRIPIVTGFVTFEANPVISALTT